MTVREIQQLRKSGRHDNTLPFNGRVLGHVKLYRERGGGGVEGGRSPKTEKPRDQDFWGRYHQGDTFFYWAAPPPNPQSALNTH